VARVPEDWIKRSMGHALKGVQGSYSHPEKIEILKTYKAAYRFLTVEGPSEQGIISEATADSARVMSAILSKDPTQLMKALEAIQNKYGKEHPLSALLKEQLDALGKQQITV